MRQPAIPQRRRQRGAVILTVCLALLFLLGFMGVALDFGHLFIVKTELQTAMDSCALAAAQELDGRPDAITRATSAGMAAGNENNVNLQSANWSGHPKIATTDITFRNSTYLITTAPAAAHYAQCEHTQPAVKLWLLQAIGAFSNNTATFPDAHDVLASAVATRSSAQSTCPVPVALKPKAGGVPPNYGFQVGEWVTVFGDRIPNSGELGWYNLDGSNSASETAKELSEGGSCGTRIGDLLGTPGAQTSVDSPWNYRFGIYKNADYDPTVNHPDFSGYAYTSNNWKNPVPQNAYAGTPAAGSHPTAQNFLSKRANFASFDDTGTDIKDGSQIVFSSRNALNSFKNLATPGTAGQHGRDGTNRRLVVVPVINGGSAVTDFVCMFMLDPLSGPQSTAHMEFLGNAAVPGSPCTTNGLPGGIAGPLVPVLVR